MTLFKSFTIREGRFGFSIGKTAQSYPTGEQEKGACVPRHSAPACQKMCQQNSYGVTHHYRCHLMFCPINIGKLKLRELSLPETKGMLANTDLLICHAEVFQSISWPPSHGSDLLCLHGRLSSWVFPSSPWVRTRDGAAQGGGEGAPGGSRTVQLGRAGVERCCGS